MLNAVGGLIQSLKNHIFEPKSPQSPSKTQPKPIEALDETNAGSQTLHRTSMRRGLSSSPSKKKSAADFVRDVSDRAFSQLEDQDDPIEVSEVSAGTHHVCLKIQN